MTLFFPHIFLLIIDVNLHKIILTTKSRIKRQEKHQRIIFIVNFFKCNERKHFYQNKNYSYDYKFEQKTEF